MIETSFEKIFVESRKNYYQNIIENLSSQKGSLSKSECFCVEIIHLMGKPTITEFANYMKISVPNANYKINRLEEKGYVKKMISDLDKREHRLVVTDKYLCSYGLNDNAYINVIQKIYDNFSQEELEQLDNLLAKIVVLIKD